MLGAITGDIVGSRFEFDNIKTKDFELFTDECEFTNDSVMSFAIAKSLLEYGGQMDVLGGLAVKNMRELGNKYCYGHYGHSFCKWLRDDWRTAYNSYRNGVWLCAFHPAALPPVL